MTIDELSREHRRIALDANVFIYLFEIEGPLAHLAAAVVDAISAGRITGVISSLVLSEAIVGPVVAGDETMAERYLDAIQSVEHLHVIPVTAEIAADAGVIRGRTGLTLPDSVHVATARTAGASALLTNDRRLRPVAHVEVIQLTDLVA